MKCMTFVGNWAFTTKSLYSTCLLFWHPRRSIADAEISVKRVKNSELELEVEHYESFDETGFRSGMSTVDWVRKFKCLSIRSSKLKCVANDGSELVFVVAIPFVSPRPHPLRLTGRKTWSISRRFEPWWPWELRLLKFLIHSSQVSIFLFLVLTAWRPEILQRFCQRHSSSKNVFLSFCQPCERSGA